MSSSNGRKGCRTEVSIPSFTAVFNPFQPWPLWGMASRWQAALAACGVWGWGRGEAQTSLFCTAVLWRSWGGGLRPNS